MKKNIIIHSCKEVARKQRGPRRHSFRGPRIPSNRPVRNCIDALISQLSPDKGFKENPAKVARLPWQINISSQVMRLHQLTIFLVPSLYLFINMPVDNSCCCFTNAAKMKKRKVINGWRDFFLISRRLITVTTEDELNYQVNVFDFVVYQELCVKYLVCQCLTFQMTTALLYMDKDEQKLEQEKGVHPKLHANVIQGDFVLMYYVTQLLA